MSTAKKNAKGNKTAHVLNLLTAPGAAKETAAPSGEETAAEGAVPEASAPSRPLLPPILEVAQANDDNLAQQIQQALEEELVPDTPAAPEPSIPPAGKESKTEEVSPPMATQPASSGKMSQDEIEKLLAAANAPEEKAAPAPEPPKPAPVLEEEDVSYINIMQALVDEKAPSYIKKFGLCTCKHCEADVKALTLTNLVPKYVVLSKLDRIPMLTVYEGRYSSTIFAQLTRACKTVMDHPHHNREA